MFQILWFALFELYIAMFCFSDSYMCFYFSKIRTINQKKRWKDTIKTPWKNGIGKPYFVGVQKQETASWHQEPISYLQTRSLWRCTLSSIEKQIVAWKGNIDNMINNLFQQLLCEQGFEPDRKQISSNTIWWVHYFQASQIPASQEFYQGSCGDKNNFFRNCVLCDMWKDGSREGGNHSCTFNSVSSSSYPKAPTNSCWKKMNEREYTNT